MVEAGTILSEHLPIMDVAQILSNEAGAARPAGPVAGDVAAADLSEQVRDYMERAAPLLAGHHQTKQNAFLLVPASAAGKALENAIHQNVPGHPSCPRRRPIRFDAVAATGLPDRR